MKIPRLIRRLREERGNAILAVAGLVLAPTLVLSVGYASLTLMRTGGDVTTAFTRDSQAQMLFERLSTTVQNASAVSPTDGKRVTLQDRPSQRHAYYAAPASGAPTTCVVNEWTLTVDGPGLKLVNSEKVYNTDDCTGTVKSTKVDELTGLTADTSLQYENAAGRDLTFAAGVEAGIGVSKNPKPAAATASDWAKNAPAWIFLRGTLVQPIGTAAIDVAARTAFHSIVPTATVALPTAPTVLVGSADDQLIATSTTVACEVGTSPEYRLRSRVAKTAVEGTWGAYSAWAKTRTVSVANPADGALYGFQAEAHCVVGTLQSGSVESVEASFLTGISSPAAPTVTVTTSGNTSTWTVKAVCATGTKARFLSADFRDDDTGWRAWSVDPTTATTKARTTSDQGYEYVTAFRAQCYTDHTESEWSGTAQASYVRPVVAPANPTDFQWRPDGSGTFTWNGGSCSGATTRQWRGFAYHWFDQGNGSTAAIWPRIWAHLDTFDANVHIAEWRKPSPSRNFNAYPTTYARDTSASKGWQNKYGTGWGTGSPQTLREARVLTQSRCINLVTKRAAESAYVFSPLLHR